MKKLLAFHNDPAIKQKYLARVQAHAQADEIVQGKYWENGKGCAVGCTIHSDRHADFAVELGLPEWLALLEDRLFENLSNDAARKFPVEFLESIPVGADLEPVKWKFFAYLIRENIERVTQLELDGALKTTVMSALRGALALHEIKISGGKVADLEWSAAWSASRAAASASRAAASAAASAWSAAWSAESASQGTAASAASAWSAWSAAWSAASAASASRVAAFSRYKDEIIRLLKAA